MGRSGAQLALTLATHVPVAPVLRVCKYRDLARQGAPQFKNLRSTCTAETGGVVQLGGHLPRSVVTVVSTHVTKVSAAPVRLIPIMKKGP
jgi:hypothetical protein